MKTGRFTTTRLSAITAGFCLLAASREALADTLNSTADTRTLNVAPNLNDGAGGNLSLYNNPGNTQYSWINFNLGGYAGQTITSDVTVTVRADTLGGSYPYLTGAAIHESNGAWAEGTLTWNNSPGFTQITTATNPADGNYSTGNNVSWTVPAYVAQKWIDDGFNGVVLTSGNTSSLHLSSANSGFAPTLSFASAISNSSGTWTSGSNGNWTTDANWSGSTHARGIDQTATFNGSTGVTVTLDADRTVGALSFDNANHTISGSEVLSLNRSSGTPTITVGATGGTRTATISAVLAGNEGLTKNGAGILVLGGGNLYTGATTVTGGTVTLNTTTSLGAWAAHPLTIYGGGKIESNWGAGNFNDLGALNLGASGQAGGELASLQSGHSQLGNYLLYGDVTG
ncbi:MAG: DNRLRE domain-containing protein, partial [Kiritimatiellia bacterium]